MERKNNQPYFVWKTRGTKEIIEANNNLHRFFSADKLQHVEQFVMNEDVDNHVLYNELVLQTKSKNIRVETFANNQESREFCVYRQPILDENNQVQYILIEAYDKSSNEFSDYVDELGHNYFKDIVESVNDLIAILDKYGTYQYVSPQWKQSLGYSFSDLAGRHHQSIMDPDNISAVNKATEPYFKNQLPFSMIEATIFSKSGRKVHIESSGTPIFNEDHELVGYRVISRDISIRKRLQNQAELINNKLEKTIHTQSKHLEASNQSMQTMLEYQLIINEISKDIINTPFDQLSDSIQRGLAKVGELSGVDRVYIFSVDDKKNEMSNDYEWCSINVEPAIGELQGLPQSIFPWWMNELRSDRLINIYDVSKMTQEQAQEKETLEMQGIQSVLVVPLYIEKELVGYLGFDSVVQKKKWNVEIQLLHMLAEIFAFTIRRQQVEGQIRDNLSETTKLFNQTIEAFSSIVEYSDPYTAGHQHAVAKLAKKIAYTMGLSDEQAHVVYIASVLHDLGKIYIPAQILNKPTPLTDIEFELIKTHPRAGYEIIKKIDFPWPIAEIILQHHEQMDGKGYPVGLSGSEILLEAKIISVADAVEAVNSHRPYRPALGLDAAVDILKKNRGIKYDKKVVDACLSIITKKDFSFSTL